MKGKSSALFENELKGYGPDEMIFRDNICLLDGQHWCVISCILCLFVTDSCQSQGFVIADYHNRDKKSPQTVSKGIVD